MNVATLEGLLPQATVDAFATTPQGITTTAHVYVAPEERADSKTDPEAWWRALDTSPDGSGVGAARSAYAYELVIFDTDGATDPETGKQRSQRWAEQINAAFNGTRLAVTRLRFARVTESQSHLHDPDGGTYVTRCVVVFHGEEE